MPVVVDVARLYDEADRLIAVSLDTTELLHRPEWFVSTLETHYQKLAKTPNAARKIRLRADYVIVVFKQPLQSSATFESILAKLQESYKFRIGEQTQHSLGEIMPAPLLKLFGRRPPRP